MLETEYNLVVSSLLSPALVSKMLDGMTCSSGVTKTKASAGMRDDGVVEESNRSISYGMFSFETKDDEIQVANRPSQNASKDRDRNR